MASAQKKPAGKGAGKKAAPAGKGKRPIRREVAGGICLLLALCLLVGYVGSDGWLIQLLPKVCRGLIGYGYYLMAPALLIAGVILLTHKGRPVALRTTCVLLAPLMWGSLWHVVLCRLDFTASVGIIPKLWESGVAMTSGGLLAGGLARFVQAIFGGIATMIIFLLLFLTLLVVVFHRQLGALWEHWQQRERLDYTEEDYPQRETVKPDPRARTQKSPRPAIDIPLDDGQPKEKRPGILSGFFRQKSRDQRTPDQVWSEEIKPDRPKDTQQEITSPFVEEPLRRAPVVSSWEDGRAAEAPPAGGKTAPVKSPVPAAEGGGEKTAHSAAAGGETACHSGSRAAAKAELEQAAAQVSAEIDENLTAGEEEYSYPPITLLNQSSSGNPAEAGAELRSNAQRLAETLVSFGVDAAPGDVVRGPAITRYEFGTSSPWSRG